MTGLYNEVSYYIREAAQLALLASIAESDDRARLCDWMGQPQQAHRIRQVHARLCVLRDAQISPADALRAAVAGRKAASAFAGGRWTEAMEWHRVLIYEIDERS